MREASYRWECVTEKAAFAPRAGAGALVFQGRMWLIGGWNPKDKTNFPKICANNVWSSADGAHWERHLEHAPWSPRHYHDITVLLGTSYDMTSPCRFDRAV